MGARGPFGLRLRIPASASAAAAKRALTHSQEPSRDPHHPPPFADSVRERFVRGAADGAEPARRHIPPPRPRARRGSGTPWAAPRRRGRPGGAARGAEVNAGQSSWLPVTPRPSAAGLSPTRISPGHTVKAGSSSRNRGLRERRTRRGRAGDRRCRCRCRRLSLRRPRPVTPPEVTTRRPRSPSEAACPRSPSEAAARGRRLRSPSAARGRRPRPLPGAGGTAVRGLRPFGCLPGSVRACPAHRAGGGVPAVAPALLERH